MKKNIYSFLYIKFNDNYKKYCLFKNGCKGRQCFYFILQEFKLNYLLNRIQTGIKMLPHSCSLNSTLNLCGMHFFKLHCRHHKLNGNMSGYEVLNS